MELVVRLTGCEYDEGIDTDGIMPINYYSRERAS